MKNFKNKKEFKEFYSNKKIYSQYGQDYLVSEFFNFKKNGVFIDVGANDGIKLSNTFYLEKELNWTGICFEPIPKTFEKLKLNRNCKIFNIGISDKESVETFVFMEPSSMMLSGILNDYHPNHLDRIKKQMKENNSKLIEVKVHCKTLEQVLTQENIFNIDYLSIDTEGNEFKIVKSIDFNKFSINLLTVENNYKNPDQTNFILSKGYELIGNLGVDEVFKKK